MDISTGHNECGMCHRRTPIVSTPAPEIVLLIQLYNKKYKGAPLCQVCYDKANTRYAAVQRKRNRENESPNTSSGTAETSETSITRPSTEPISTDSRTERGDSLTAQMGTQATRTFSQHIDSLENLRVESSQGNRQEIPPFIPENAEEVITVVTEALNRDDQDKFSSTPSTETPAMLEISTPEPRFSEGNRKRTPDRNNEPSPSPKRSRVVVVEEVETIEETEADVPPEEVIQETPESPESTETSSSDDDDEIEIIDDVSTAAPVPKNPRLRDENLRDLMEKREDLESRGAAIVNNMPRTHAG